MSKEKLYRKMLIAIAETLEEENMMVHLASTIRKSIMKIEGVK